MASSHFVIVLAQDAVTWDGYINMLPYEFRDIHFTSAWARAHETDTQRGGLAVWVNDAGGYIVCQPFMLRDIPGTDSKDLTAIGYGGPVTSAMIPNASDGMHFEEGFAEWRREYGIVSEFYLLGPCYQPHQWVLLPEQPHPEREVFIVHLGSDDEIHSRLRATRRQSMEKAGYAVMDSELTPAAFHVMYDIAMKAKGAPARWRLTLRHFEQLQHELRDKMSIIAMAPVPRKEPTHALAAAVFLRGTGVAYYHLAATAPERVSGYADLCIIAGMVAARSVGCMYLDMGGGLTADDTLATYKRSFGGVPRMTYSIRRIYDVERYAELTKAVGIFETPFFPAYRALEASR